MFKNLDLDNDATIKSFQSFKNFSFTNNDSGSGVFAIKARSGSRFNYVSSSDASTQPVRSLRPESCRPLYTSRWNLNKLNHQSLTT